MKISVIMPAYNERATILEIISRVQAVDLPKEILVVDDGSRDGTRKILQDLTGPGLRIFFHERNRGKGAAIRTALPYVTGEILIIQDADLEYDPAEYPKLIAPITAGAADVVYGSRFLGRGRGSAGILHYAANRLLTAISNLFTGLRLTDMETCYKALRVDLVRRLELVSNSFEIEPEITAKAARLGARFREVPIHYAGRSYGEGKKIGLCDGIRALRTILRYGMPRARR
ncbi:MAG: glycosyltransferase family 2 protein [Candidatus Eisenbacteria sp.]|nr:glycosyltransferase family 2 protein [Candidatus Eisenbacteria bacterium]